MAALLQLAARPASGSDPTTRSRYRSVGLALALVGIMGASASVIGNFVAADGIGATDSYQQTLAWTFGLSIFSFGVIKISIAVILMGIIVRLWHRVDSVTSVLARDIRSSSLANNANDYVVPCNDARVLREAR